MNTFDYIRPTTIAAAVAAAAEPGAAYLAGGTNLLDLMKGGVAQPGRLVDVTRLPGLDQIEHLADGSVRPFTADTSETVLGRMADRQAPREGLP